VKPVPLLPAFLAVEEVAEAVEADRMKDVMAEEVETGMEVVDPVLMTGTWTVLAVVVQVRCVMEEEGT
jgi:hypothetical protein